ncbi:hypothetical protein Ami103574_04105 [Aminipila butyrica]|uniref:ABC-2 family transporter protein n=1 Tax=Aminipila butyrica TaxID=433296 RepID=A0A858BRM9_9FIRM|nr:hypothetical protein [Aminipila butyrica]QIB68553.1 hypothetical protein Ami103574_04105 [Aminipila butyrica]
MMNKDRSIEYILDQGLVKPKNAGEQAVDIFRSLGWKFLFWDTAYGLIFAALTLVVIVVVLISVPDNYRFSATASAAPLLYLLIAVFTEMAERANGLYELKQTCRYTPGQVTALRTTCYSVAGAVYTAILALINMRGSEEFLPLLALGLFALFVCAVPQLLIVRLIRCKWANGLYAVLWVIINLTLFIRFGEAWEEILLTLPMTLSFSVAAAGAIILAYQIQKMLTEVEPYAIP